jgi:hypothetical protein
MRQPTASPRLRIRPNLHLSQSTKHLLEMNQQNEASPYYLTEKPEATNLDNLKATGERPSTINGLS